MSHYKHLSMEEREWILILHTEKRSVRNISNKLGRSPSTIARELNRNTAKRGYSALEAERKYYLRRKK